MEEKGADSGDGDSYRYHYRAEMLACRWRFYPILSFVFLSYRRLSDRGVQKPLRFAQPAFVSSHANALRISFVRFCRFWRNALAGVFSPFGFSRVRACAVSDIRQEVRLSSGLQTACVAYLSRNTETVKRQKLTSRRRTTARSAGRWLAPSRIWQGQHCARRP